MRITDLSLTHYRGAESLHLELDPHLNVFVGVNGSGKSTVLDAVAIMLSWAVNRIKSVGASGRPISEADITNGFSSASINLTCINDNQVLSWKLAKSRKGRSSSDNQSNLNQLNQFTKQIQKDIGVVDNGFNLTTLIHYPVNRAVLDIPLKIRNKAVFDILSTYNESFTSGVSFRAFFEWFREREDLENENWIGLNFPSVVSSDIYGKLEEFIHNGETIIRLSRGFNISRENIDDSKYNRNIFEMYLFWRSTCLSVLEEITKNVEGIDRLHSWFLNAMNFDELNFEIIKRGIKALSDLNISLRNIDNLNTLKSRDFKDNQLRSVRIALQKFLPDFADFTIRRNPLRMEVKKNGKTMIINQLSDGEKCLIALIGDLARRMAIANPTRDNSLEGNGIVLIDEIDLHLHPKWQRNIIPRLTEVFPNCQFIISTHSPHVINHVQPENIFLLDQTPEGIVASHPSKSYGNNADRILEDLMGLETTRPDEVFQELRSIFSLIGSNSLSEAVEKIADLKKKIGTDPEIVKAEVLLARKKIIGK
jgi:predicted ATP-binding protein involved in virulence